MRIFSTHTRLCDIWRAAMAIAVALVATNAVGGCAYYNLLYNARAKYRDAFKATPNRDGTLTRQQEQFLETAIGKAQRVVDEYPNSRWVDDAMLLIAQSELALGNYESAVAQVERLESDKPESDLLGRAQFLKGEALARWGKDERALNTLDEFLRDNRGDDNEDKALFLAGRAAMVSGDEERAVAYLDRLRAEHPHSDVRLDADLEVAEILMERKDFEKSIQVYERINESRIPEMRRFRAWNGTAKAYLGAGRFADALAMMTKAQAAIAGVEGTAERRAGVMLMRAEAYQGVDSLGPALDVYQTVAAVFKKSKFSAEAQYRAGLIYQERLDSLETAKGHFEEVSKQYARSEYAADAIKRSSNIDKLMRLRAEPAENSPGALAEREFSLAEIQLLQFGKTEEALEGYQMVLESYPGTKWAPKAAFAIGYIHQSVEGDSIRARLAFKWLIEHYPDSQQAAYAAHFLVVGGAAADSLIRLNPEPAPADAPADSTGSGSDGTDSGGDAAKSAGVWRGP